MKTFVTLALLASTALAYPGEVLRKRALTKKDLDPRTGCPKELPAGQFEYPHYITQISKSQPDKAFGKFSRLYQFALDSLTSSRPPV